MESRAEEIQNCYKDNDKLREDVRKLSVQLSEYEQNIHKLCEKYLALKKRKDIKVCFYTAHYVIDNMLVVNDGSSRFISLIWLNSNQLFI